MGKREQKRRLKLISERARQKRKENRKLQEQGLLPINNDDDNVDNVVEVEPISIEIISMDENNVNYEQEQEQSTIGRFK